jgi:hypothetical protein
VKEDQRKSGIIAKTAKRMKERDDKAKLNLQINDWKYK